jgi:hypothetical protein
MNATAIATTSENPFSGDLYLEFSGPKAGSRASKEVDHLRRNGYMAALAPGKNGFVVHASPK